MYLFLNPTPTVDTHALSEDLCAFDGASSHVVSTVAHENQFVDVVLLLSGHGVAPHGNHSDRGGTAIFLVDVFHSLVEEPDKAGELRDVEDLVAVLNGGN